MGIMSGARRFTASIGLACALVVGAGAAQGDRDRGPLSRAPVGARPEGARGTLLRVPLRRGHVRGPRSVRGRGRAGVGALGGAGDEREAGAVPAHRPPASGEGVGGARERAPRLRPHLRRRDERLASAPAAFRIEPRQSAAHRRSGDERSRGRTNERSRADREGHRRNAGARRTCTRPARCPAACRSRPCRSSPARGSGGAAQRWAGRRAKHATAADCRGGRTSRRRRRSRRPSPESGQASWAGSASAGAPPLPLTSRSVRSISRVS